MWFFGIVLPTAVSAYVFHLIEFWATFGFAIIEAYALLNTPKTLSNIYEVRTAARVVCDGFAYCRVRRSPAQPPRASPDGSNPSR